MDFNKLMKLDLSYPGVSFGYHSWSLGIYLARSIHGRSIVSPDFERAGGCVRRLHGAGI